MFSQKKIIMITPERLGDTLMCTPALAYFKLHYPDCQIYIIALSELSAQVLQNNPAVHQVYVLPSHKFLTQLKHDLDYAINIHYGDLIQSYLTLLKSFGIPVFEIPRVKPHYHQAQQCLDFIQTLIQGPTEPREFFYKIYPNREDEIYINNLLIEKKIDLQRHLLIGCQIGCHSVSRKKFLLSSSPQHPKIWPLEHIQAFAKLCEKHNKDIKIIITGSKSEKSLAKKLLKNCPNLISFVDETTVPQLQALLKLLKVFISPDTGLMHVACSAHIPLIALFGPTEIRRTGPFGKIKQLTVIQAPSMNHITPESVFKAALKALS